MVSRQSAEVCDHTIVPNYGDEGCAVSAATFPDDLALVVNCPGDVGTLGPKARKRESPAVFPHHGVKRCSAVSRVAYGLAPFVDGIGLPVISAHRRESPHVAVSPKKRTTRKFCAKAANVFTVRIWNTCFGETDRLPAVVEPAIAYETVFSSKRTEVDPEFVDLYYRVAR